MKNQGLVAAWRRGGRRGDAKNGTRPSRRPRGSMQIERLEQRQLLTILYWDPNGTSGGLGGSGTWVANNWSTQSPPQTGSTGQPWANGDIAVFPGTSGGTVNIASTAVNAAAIEFSTGGYTISANSNTPLTLPSGTTTPITVPTGQNETISAVISGGGNMALSGGAGRWSSPQRTRTRVARRSIAEPCS